MDWVENTTMVDVIKRHNPTLALSLTGMDNAFKPWGLNMPAEYESWSAGAKADHLWVNGALRTQYKTTMPNLKPVDTGGLISSILWKKVQNTHRCGSGRLHQADPSRTRQPWPR
jgi:hypothetical protein